MFFPIILYSLSCPQLATYPPTLSALTKEMGCVGKYFSIVQICKPVGSCFPTYFCCLCLFAKKTLFLKTTQHYVVVLRVNFHPDWARYCTLLVPLCRWLFGWLFAQLSTCAGWAIAGNHFPCNGFISSDWQKIEVRMVGIIRTKEDSKISWRLVWKCGCPVECCVKKF